MATQQDTQQGENTPAQGEQAKKNRFQISREVQQEFVNEVAQNMLTLAEMGGDKWQKPWGNEPVGLPYCATTGRQYGGANMVKLMLTGLVRGYADDRWMTFKQLEQFKDEHPALDLQITKGAKGVKLLRPEEIVFTVGEDGKWNYLNEKQVKEYEEMKAQGLETPKIERMTLFYPFTVFNAAQIQGFPPKEGHIPKMSEVERNEFVERFVACSGIRVTHHNGDACYSPADDVVKLPLPQNFKVTDEYYATKLHEAYHATGHESRENRKEKPAEGLKNYAFEEMRAEMFSMLAGAHLDLPMPEQNSAVYIRNWNQKFSGGDVKAVFKAATEAARMLTVMHQFEMGEQPRARWFPPSEDWPALVERQQHMDEQCGVKFSAEAPAQAAAVVTPEVAARSAPDSLQEAQAAFLQANDPTVQARILLHNPDLLQKALTFEEARGTSNLADLLSAFNASLNSELRNAEGHKMAASQEERYSPSMGV